jgi:hypothetical protein
MVHAVHRYKIGTSELDPFRKTDDFRLVSVVVPVSGAHRGAIMIQAQRGRVAQNIAKVDDFRIDTDGRDVSR